MGTASVIGLAFAVLVSLSTAEAGRASLFRWFSPFDPPSDVLDKDNNPLPVEDDPVCEGQAQSCIDCYTVRICAKLPDFRPVANMTCPSNTPYCSKGVCVSNLPEGSECADGDTTSSTFKCNGDGYFPDPTDCTKYHLCVNGKATDYDCKMYPFTVYDQSSTQCRPKNQAQCFTFKCAGNKVNTYQWYGPDNTVYGFCVNQDSSKIQLSKCPSNHRINITDTVDPKCIPYCARQGRFADESDSSRFYECAGKPGNLVGPLAKGCPRDSVFNADKERCEASTSSSTESPSSSTTPSGGTTQATETETTPAGSESTTIAAAESTTIAVTESTTIQAGPPGGGL